MNDYLILSSIVCLWLTGCGPGADYRYLPKVTEIPTLPASWLASYPPSGGYELPADVPLISEENNSPLFLFAMQEGDRIKLRVVSSGCFQYSIYEIQIIKNKAAYQVQYGDHKKDLTTKQWRSLMKFERELSLLKNNTGSCTNVDTYILSAKGRAFIIKDSSCRWGGIQNLLEALQLSSEQIQVSEPQRS
ncbi:hypothetical protein HMPREF0765_0754 [Sphingobacterium spiritivorum ATCC 33300]|uniref:Uncharacterized protein n=1 Tax=Sphingobacterium spiritivorum ATCC 33300 TaxID=525372 RepID=C2FTX2_SPHSI|nr:hypothetical protein [Sphingobacterium spiritivorum]EEI93602.1 hypothetical protein HMPREF0765_0754 [Sphingobacterium spiritivorum ATCC 33300]QQS95694.1 hypothetical protein I6J03_20340 [Sphingobacterium spiritivorum]